MFQVPYRSSSITTGPTDFSQMDAHRLPEGQVHNPADSPESQFVGGALQENLAAVARANPITYVNEGDAPFLVVHGDSDPLVPHHQSEILVAALKAANVPVVFYTVAGVWTTADLPILRWSS